MQMKEHGRTQCLKIEGVVNGQTPREPKDSNECQLQFQRLLVFPEELINSTAIHSIYFRNQRTQSNGIKRAEVG